MAGDRCRARTTPHQQQPQHPLPLDARHRHTAPRSVHCGSPSPQRPSNYDGTTPPHSQYPPSAARLDPPVTGVSTTPLITMDSKKGSGVGGGAVGGGVHGRRRGGSGGGGAAPGSTQQLRSPAVKRPAAAPVALQGWLHKQGSEGLMLWKKRWFVLCDYCLFYYKGPEEEKLLGSILLPSYKVAPCAPEDRVFRKFSFKAEHANMRTYYFAADSRELMVQWMNALSLASILQDGSSLEEHRSGRPSVSSVSSLLNASVDDSDSGFHGYRPRSGASSSAAGALGSSSGKIEGQIPSTKTPLNSSHDSALSNGWMAQRLSPQQRSGDVFTFHQPLYANAPPKPRRMTNEPDDYSITSPGRMPENCQLDATINFQEEQLNPITYELPVAQPQESVSNDARQVELRHHYHISPTARQYGGPNLTASANIERRTPDTYGRSNSTTPAPTYPHLLARGARDYEDVYNHTPAATTGGGSSSYLTHVYRRHSSQMTPLHAKGLSSQQLYGTVPKVQADGVPPVPPHGSQLGHVSQPTVSTTTHTTFRYSVQDGEGTCSRIPFYSTGTGVESLATPLHHRVGRHPPRPHSADFLEYDTRHQQFAYQQHSLPHPHRDQVFNAESYVDTQRVAPLQRPKSSLDVMTREAASTDNYYWSEESYAQKMRQSASYVHQIPTTALYRGQSATSRATASKRTANQSSISGMVGDSVSTQSASSGTGGTTNDEIGALRQNKAPDTSCRITEPHGIEGWTADARAIGHRVTSGRRVSSDPRIPTDSRIEPRTFNEPRSPSRPHYRQLQQRRWSEYSDSRGSSQFMRSASARLPRARNQDDDCDLKFDDFHQRSKSDVREGERKIQQREESMKRLLEWKQRMLQSPLTRKASGSSVRGTAQNELSRYFKQQQQVLRELVGSEDTDVSRRHRPLPEDSYTIPGPGRSAFRSRSQDGRRSSASVNRYNSFSSDDEEEGEVRKARKRVRRPVQAGRSRPGSTEGRSARRQPPSASPPTAASVAGNALRVSGAASISTSNPPVTVTTSASTNNEQPTYENIIPMKSSSSHYHHHHKKTHEDIPPDVMYGENQHHFGVDKNCSSKREKVQFLDSHCHGEQSQKLDGKPREANYQERATLSTQIKYSPEMPVIVSSTLHKYPDYQLKSGNNTLDKASVDGLSKHQLAEKPTCAKIIEAEQEFHENQEMVNLLQIGIPERNLRDSSEMYTSVSNAQVKSSVEKSSQKESELGDKTNESTSKHSITVDPIHFQQEETCPKNISHSRNRSFDKSKDTESNNPLSNLQMQEPLKMSPPIYQPNEAYVSSLRGHDMRPGVSDGAGKQNTAMQNMASSEMLLVDFEGKSLLAKSTVVEGSKVERRCVFSDSETLMYDSSSDGTACASLVDELCARPLRPKSCYRPSSVTASDEDKDEEVAAALGKSTKFVSTCRDLGRLKPHKRREVEGIRDSANRVEMIVTPGYLRLSIAESLVTHEDSESICSTPSNVHPLPNPDVILKHSRSTTPDEASSTNPEEHYMPMTPSRKAVLAPLPDAFGSPASRVVTMESIFSAGEDVEESAYVEMTEEGIVRSLLASEPNPSFLTETDLRRLNSSAPSVHLSQESPRYCEIGTVFLEGTMNKPPSNYEVLYRKSCQEGEPVYMEVKPRILNLKSEDAAFCNSKLASGHRNANPCECFSREDFKHSRLGEEEAMMVGATTVSSRASLPDILHTSSAPQVPAGSKRDRDSSDADDEASKDLDSLDVPRHPRFSLSDTFRPASYYLGHASCREGIIGPLSPDHQDSSDSDLVPPPPIPTSPPIDELDYSLELPDSSFDSSPRVKINSVLKQDENEQRGDIKVLWGKDNSVDAKSCDNEHLEIRTHTPENIVKRRPVSDELLESLKPLYSITEEQRAGSDLESVGSRSGFALNSTDIVKNEIAHYLNDVDLTNQTDSAACATIGQPPTANRTEQSARSSACSSHPVNNIASMPQHSRLLFLRPDPDGEALYENLQPTLPSSSLTDMRLDEELNPNVTPTLETVSDGMTRPVLSSGNAARSSPMDEKQLQQNAPYYYSDLLKSQEPRAALASNIRSVGGYPLFVSSSVATRVPVISSRAQLLNNQRNGCSSATVRSDIGRKVNPIHRVSESSPSHIATESESLHSIPPSITSCTDDPRLLAAELRSSSVQFLGTTDKRGRVDERNLYEADTIQRCKATRDTSVDWMRSRSPDITSCAVTSFINLYPQGLRDKNLPRDSSQNDFIFQPQRRSRSLEGLLDEPVADEARNFHERLATVEPFPPPAAFRSVEVTVSGETPPLEVVRQQPPDSSPSEQPPGGFTDDLWEEDTLWRESLRRVSLRHTRSLDNLDSGIGAHTRQLSQICVSNVSGTAVPTTSSVHSGTDEAAQLPTCSRLTRSATYVNEKMLPRMGCLRPPREYEEDYREGRKCGRRRPQEALSGGGSETAASCSERDDGVHYERLARYSESLERTRRGLTYLEGYVWDADQEVFRKGDSNCDVLPPDVADPTSLASTPAAPQRTMPQEQRHFLEDGRLPPQSQSTFEIDREKLRQWDCLSSAPLSAQVPPTLHQATAVGMVAGVGHGPTQELVAVEAAVSATKESESNAATKVEHQPTHDRLHLQQREQQPDSGDILQEGSNTTASASGSVIGRDPLPSRAESAVTIQQQQNTLQPLLSTLTIEDQALTKSTDTLHTKACSPGVSNKGLATLNTCTTNALPNEDIPSFDSVIHESTSKDSSGGNEDQTKRGPGGEEVRHMRLNVSAGELLGRTHEELVLLLIQLRRQSAGICKAMEICHMDIEVQARVTSVETSQRLDHLRKLEELKKHLLDLEKQYEKGKPLVNLVDNMVKLGSLYRSSTGQLKTGFGGVTDSDSVRERLEFNHKVQEQRLLAEERRDWKRLSPDHSQLQAKVQELYRLDRLLQEESGTLHSLQKNKELLEKALGGLRHKLEIARSNPTEAERYRKQQKLLERELSRIRMLLAHNSKKLEETVAENVRLEQELVVLRQKLQASRRTPQNLPRTSAFYLQDSSALSCTSALETELLRVQQVVGDLQRQRQELSMQVRQLTEKSHSLVQQIRPGPTGVPGAGATPGRKRQHSTWLETDLDSMVTLDRGLESPGSPQHQPCPGNVVSDSHAPLYINTCSKEDEFCLQSTINEGQNIPPPLPNEISPEYTSLPPHPPLPSEEVLLNVGIDPDLQYCSQMDISEADDRIKRFYGIIPKEKQQEIKTVRIVKRESERRQRDRDRSGNIGIPLTNGPGSPGKRPSLSEEAETTSDKEYSVSLLHDFGKEDELLCQQEIIIPPPPVRVPSPRSDSVTILRNLMMHKHRVRFESCSGRCSSSESTNSQGTNSPSGSHPLSAQLSMVSSGSSDASPQLSPIFKSEAARAIVMEISAPRDYNSQLRKRSVPREKRRHHTVSSSRPMRDMESNLSEMGSTRSRDDLDMERVLRPRLNAPDVVRSTLSHKDFKYNEDTIDNILGVPNKIIIPERYVPEQLPELSAEEQLHRSKKAEAIRKMLSEITLTSTDVKESEPEEETSTLKKKLAAEKKQREHILQLNQILAKQVMEKSKIVAGSTSVQPLD